MDNLTLTPAERSVDPCDRRSEAQLEAIRGGTMATYIAMDRGGLADIAAAARRGERPRHAMTELADIISAEIIYPSEEAVSLVDTLLAQMIGTPKGWAFARHLRHRLAPGDVIFCVNEAIGFPIAAICGHRAAVVLMAHNIVRPRAAAALRLLGLKRRVAAFIAVSRVQTGYLQSIGIPSNRLLYVNDQTDTKYFSPGILSLTTRPIIMSVGLEQRDYRTLASATETLDVDVRISGFSSDAIAIARAFPQPMPANMTRSYYEWTDLLALYRNAAIVVVCLFPNRYAAGVQVMLEAIACGRPLIVTATEGLAEYLNRPDLITLVPPGDAAAIRSAILAKLANPDAALKQASAAREYYLPKIDSTAYNRAIADGLRRVVA